MNSRLTVLALLLVLLAWSGPSVLVKAHDECSALDANSDSGDNDADDSHGSGQTSSGSSGSGDSDSEEKKACRSNKIVQCGCAAASTGSTQEATTTTAGSTSAASESTDSTTQASTTQASSTESSVSSTVSSNSSCPDELDQDEPCPCELMRGLKKLKLIFLTLEEQDVFEVCLKEVREVLVDKNRNYEQKVAKIGHKLKKCCKKNKGICKKIKYKQISSSISKTMSFADFCHVAANNDAKRSSSKMFAMDSEGNCNVTKSIEEGVKGDKCGPGSEQLIVKVLGKLKKRMKKDTPGDDKGRKLGWFKKGLVKMLFVQYPEYADCVRNISIQGFGSVDQALTMCSEFEKSSSMSVSIINGTAEECVLLKSLREGINATANTTDVETLKEATELVTNCTVFFSTTEDVVLRVKFVSAQFSRLRKKTRNFLKSITIKGTMLDYDDDDLEFDDCVATSHFCENSGCGNMTYGGASLTWEESNMVDNDNVSTVEEAVDAFYFNLTGTDRTQFNGYRLSIKNCIRAATLPPEFTEGATPKGRLRCTKKYIAGYYNTLGTRPLIRKKFVSWEINTVFIETVTTVIFGTLGNISPCGCQS